MSNLCPQCGAPAPENAVKCEYCGAAITNNNVESTQPANVQVQPQTVYVQQPQGADAARANWPIKNKMVAGILAILLGGLGIHKFYLGKTVMGILYILFCWTYIPSIIGLIEGIMILCSNDENFQIKYKCRLG
ncbi:MAG: NINE protein [Clostridia bacterium]|nr:NINE protein [Clostridia bacterium]